MKNQRVLKVKRVWGLIAVSTASFFMFMAPGSVKGAKIPSVDDVIKGKVKLPTIEDLTSGKVKEGDLIAKDNVDLVKEYL
ncbi:MAG: hypothetical protein SV775_19315, partial [Thermodesulfobacteriota bacterium]|nr:hypothetical protein [Thermodesulfobacteriota bacterium]